jgi:hypothetical protein
MFTGEITHPLRFLYFLNYVDYFINFIHMSSSLDKHVAHFYYCFLRFFFFCKKLAPYTLTGFDLTTRM